MTYYKSQLYHVSMYISKYIHILWVHYTDMAFTTCIIIVIMIIMIWRHMANVEFDQIWSPEKRWSTLRLKLCVIGDVVFNHMLVPPDFETTGRAWGMSCRFWKLPSWERSNIIPPAMEEDSIIGTQLTSNGICFRVPRKFEGALKGRCRKFTKKNFHTPLLGRELTCVNFPGFRTVFFSAPNTQACQPIILNFGSLVPYQGHVAFGRPIVVPLIRCKIPKIMGWQACVSAERTCCGLKDNQFPLNHDYGGKSQTTMNIYFSTSFKPSFCLLRTQLSSPPTSSNSGHFFGWPVWSPGPGGWYV